MSRSEESDNFRARNYRSALKLQWWLSVNHVPFEWSNQLNRKELIILKDIIEEDMKQSEA